MLQKIVNISPGSFRLILALTVVVFHAVSFISFGHAVVYMFFVLSGYWIFKMYSRADTDASLWKSQFGLTLEVCMCGVWEYRKIQLICLYLPPLPTFNCKSSAGQAASHDACCGRCQRRRQWHSFRFARLGPCATTEQSQNGGGAGSQSHLQWLIYVAKIW